MPRAPATICTHREHVLLAGAKLEHIRGQAHDEAGVTAAMVGDVSAVKVNLGVLQGGVEDELDTRAGASGRS